MPPPTDTHSMTTPPPPEKNQKHESSVLTHSAIDGIQARDELFALMNGYASTPEEKERSLGLFLRGSLLARILAVAHIYQQIVEIPGIVFDIGTWRGQTAVLCENFRAIYEPLHFNRRIVCFDTFEGYAGFGDQDRATALHQEGTYSVGGTAYADHLAHLLQVHERANAMGHNNGKHQVIAGDCRETIPAFFEDHPNEILSLAFFDVNALAPTREALDQVWKRLAPGGIVAFWQLTRAGMRAEGQAYAADILNQHRHTLHRAPTYPSLCYARKM